MLISVETNRLAVASFSSALKIFATITMFAIQGMAASRITTESSILSMSGKNVRVIKTVTNKITIG